jgi:hypothetical protein
MTSDFSYCLLRPALVCFLLDCFVINHGASFSVNTPFGVCELTLLGEEGGVINEEGISGAPRIHQRLLSHL